MSSDPEFVAEARAWLVKANSDLRSAELIAGSDSALAGNALYHCQQAAEKTLKGFLAWHACIFRKTHDIAELGHQVLDIRPQLEMLLRECALLTDYASKFRYPGESADPGPDEVPTAVTLARRLNEAILAELPRELWP
jgi:HEPN domain-containing protein